MLRLACFISYFMAVAISVAGAPLRSGPAAAGLRPSSAHHSGLREGGSTSDWPAYRHDNRRSGMTEETLSLPLSPAWRYVCPQPPAPAWPLSLRKAHLMDFDYAAAPVVAGGLLVFGSSADDTVRALDARTGAERWHFISDGPVRFAPQLASNRVYFGSDDGCVYCLEAATGKPVWIFNTAPADEALIGNGRMISRWPIRTGVLVHDNLVFAVAGMWPAEGIYVYALDAASGKIVWCNDTSGLAARGIGQPWDAGDPHRGEFSFLGPTPQGALLASRDFLIAPLGLNAPAY
ncbi:MAG: PQQ-binding-like beta-propeller repeat protein, partial [Lentisphaerae bacterium]|nr:PQQ-binding-like beta-propeller repeat protein [Lentisphaerota bacterium]